MSTKIELSINEIYAAIETYLKRDTGWFELLIPEIPELNDDLTSRQAWGITFGGDSNSNREFGCDNLSRIQSFQITLMRKLFAGTTRNPEQFEKRRDVNIALHNDARAVIKILEKDPDISEYENIAKLDYLNHGGISLVRTGSMTYLMLQMDFEFEYFDNLKT